MKVLVTGGLGYIGSHTVVALVEAGHQVIVVDNGSSNIPDAHNRINSLIDGRNVTFVTCDISNDYLLLRGIFSKENLDAVIHLAACKSVEQSMLYPDKYFNNNVRATQDIAQLAIYFKVPKIVFSSSAAVYPLSSESCIEDVVIDEENTHLSVYGKTKLLSERDLKPIIACVPNSSVTVFRYFNVIGNHHSGLLLDTSLHNLVPNIIRALIPPGDKLSVYKAPTPTLDGTCIRDYVHVLDVARLNVEALHKNIKGYNVYNVGSGVGTSTKELIALFEAFSGLKIPYKMLPAREGDTTYLVADISKAKRDLGWVPHYSLPDMVTSVLGSCPTIQKNLEVVGQG